MDEGSALTKDRKPYECEEEVTYAQKVTKLAQEEVDFMMAEQELMDTLAEQDRLHDAGQREIVDLQMRYEQQDEEYQKLKVEGRTRILKWFRVLKTLDSGIQSHGERLTQDLHLHREQRLQQQARVDTLEPQLQQMTTTMRNNQNTRSIELNSLKEQVHAAEEGNELCQSLRSRAERYQQMAMGMSEDKVQSAEQELLAARSNNQQKKRLLDTLIQENREITSLIVQNDEELKAMESDYANKMEELNSFKLNNGLTISKYESEIESLNTSILNQSNFTNTILDENAQARQNICDLKKENHENMRETEELNKQIAEMSSDMDFIMTNMAVLDGETSEGNDGTDKKAGTLTVLKERLESLTADLAHHNNQFACEQKTYDEEKACLQPQIDQCTAENASRKSLEELEGELAKMAKEIAELEKYQESNEQKRVQEIAHLTGLIDDKTTSVTKLNEEIQRLECEVGAASAALEERKLVADEQAKEYHVVSGKLTSLRKELAGEETEDKKWTKATEKLKKAILICKKKSEDLNNEMLAQDANTSRLEEERARRKAELVNRIAQLDKEAAGDGEAIKKMEANQTDCNDEFNKMKKEHELEMSALNKELADLKQAADTDSTRISNLQTELRDSDDGVAKAATEYDAMMKQIYALRKELNETETTKTPQKGKENALPAPTSSMKQQPSSKPPGKSVHFSMPPPSKRHVYDYSSDSDADGGLGNPRNLWPRRPAPTLSKRRKSTDTSAAPTSMQPPGHHTVWRSTQKKPPSRTLNTPDIPMREHPTRDTKK